MVLPHEYQPQDTFNEYLWSRRTTKPSSQSANDREDFPFKSFTFRQIKAHDDPAEWVRELKISLLENGATEYAFVAWPPELISAFLAYPRNMYNGRSNLRTEYMRTHKPPYVWWNMFDENNSVKVEQENPCEAQILLSLYGDDVQALKRWFTTNMTLKEVETRLTEIQNGMVHSKALVAVLLNQCVPHSFWSDFSGVTTLASFLNTVQTLPAKLMYSDLHHALLRVEKFTSTDPLSVSNRLSSTSQRGDYEYLRTVGLRTAQDVELLDGYEMEDIRHYMLSSLIANLASEVQEVCGALKIPSLNIEELLQIDKNINRLTVDEATVLVDELITLLKTPRERISPTESVSSKDLIEIESSEIEPSPSIENSNEPESIPLVERKRTISSKDFIDAEQSESPGLAELHGKNSTNDDENESDDNGRTDSSYNYDENDLLYGKRHRLRERSPVSRRTQSPALDLSDRLGSSHSHTMDGSSRHGRYRDLWDEGDPRVRSKPSSTYRSYESSQDTKYGSREKRERYGADYDYDSRRGSSHYYDEYDSHRRRRSISRSRSRSPSNYSGSSSYDRRRRSPSYYKNSSRGYDSPNDESDLFARRLNRPKPEPRYEEANERWMPNRWKSEK